MTGDNTDTIGLPKPNLLPHTHRQRMTTPAQDNPPPSQAQAQARSTPSMTSPPLSWQDQDRYPIYFISTDHSLLDLEAINDALDTEDVYWTQRMEEARLKRMLDLSLCFGVYTTTPQDSTSTSSLTSATLHDATDSSEESQTKQYMQIGLARLVTDTTSFAYLTDVYILAPHRGRGLATWLMRCVTRVVSDWPDLRRVALFASGGHARRFYTRELGMESFRALGEGAGGGGGEGGHGEEGEGAGAGGDGIEFLMLPERKDIRGLELLVRDGAWR